MTRLVASVFTVVLLGSAACHSKTTAPETLVTVSLDRSSYQPGDRIRMTLSTESLEDIELGQCSTRLEHWESSNHLWSIARETVGSCRPVALHFKQGRPVTIPYLLPLDLPPGRYRLVETTLPFYSKAFSVIAGGAEK